MLQEEAEAIADVYGPMSQDFDVIVRIVNNGLGGFGYGLYALEDGGAAGGLFRIFYGYSGTSAESGDGKNEGWDPLNKNDVEALNMAGIALGGTTALAYAAGDPEVSVIVNKITAIPASGIAVTILLIHAQIILGQIDQVVKKPGQILIQP